VVAVPLVLDASLEGFVSRDASGDFFSEPALSELDDAAGAERESVL
jgi:hypothetical protein